ncbi:ribonuclease P protein component 1 [Candidatus Thorarchaeota archaeon]|nr:MAG: ribonuclease P protein component 1 [Candidatus Thorarchaeota archaeon]
MKITPENILRHELTGLSIHIIESRDPNFMCRKGSVLRESKEMLHLDTTRGEMQVPKRICVFDMTLPDGSIVRLDGEVLVGRPEDRVKKRLNRSW